MIVIATFRTPKVWLQTAGALIIVFAGCWFIENYFFRIINSPNRGYLIFCLVGFCACLPIALRSIFIALRQLVFEQGAAVWIKNGIINTWLFSIPCDEVKTITAALQNVSTFVKKDAVILQLKNGTRKTFPVGSLSEQRDTIIAQLNEALSQNPST